MKWLCGICCGVAVSVVVGGGGNMYSEGIARQNEKEKRKNQYVQWACVGVWVIVRIARSTLGTWSEPKNPAIAH